MAMQFHNENVLITRLKTNKKDTTFVLGSAFSKEKDGAGIPDVTRVCEFVKAHAEENGIIDVYLAELKAADTKDLYQKSFSLISGMLGPESVNEIIRKVVDSNVDDQGKQRIPQCIKDFVTGIRLGRFKATNIITTNFDTLLEEELENQGIPANSYHMVTDGHINETRNDNINIYHLHGVWNTGDSMHTGIQLSEVRSRIENSLRNKFDGTTMVIMGYGGWEDSFTRSLAAEVMNNQSKYDLLWCFYEGIDAVIEKNESALFSKLSDAITRGRIHFFKGIDCNSVFSKLSTTSEIKKKQKADSDLDRKLLEIVNYYDIEDKIYSCKIRGKERQRAIDILSSENALFIRSGLGFGAYDFISSLKSATNGMTAKFLRIDCAGVISKNQIDNKVIAGTGQSISQLAFLLNGNERDVHFIIFDKISTDASGELLQYLLSMIGAFNVLSKNVFFIYTSSFDIKQFQKIRIEINALDLHDTQLILHERFGKEYFSSVQILQIHELSEGVTDKLDRIMDYLMISSVEEVLYQDDIFDNDFHVEHIPSDMRKKIDGLITDPTKHLTLKMLKILSILKNGETLTNLRQDKMGIDLYAKNTLELVQLELASTVMIDSSTMLIKINPIIKDYILNGMSPEEIADISNAYLDVTLIGTKKGMKLSSINRKIFKKGYNTEEDNTGTLLRYAIQNCRDSINKNDSIGESNEMNFRRMNKLLYWSNTYVYILKSSSRFAETITAFENLIGILKEVNDDRLYKYYLYVASAHRMKSNYDECENYLNLCERDCPESDKSTLEEIYAERLYLLEMTDPSAAINLAKSSKRKFNKKSVAYIVSDVVLASAKDNEARFDALVKLEKQARKLGYITTANNILFTINNKRPYPEKIKYLDEALASDQTVYNLCRATIYKNQALIKVGAISKIKDSDVSQLINIYNYLFRQRIDTLFYQCHDVLWSIAESKQSLDVILFIFFRGTIVWKLNSNYELEEKYTGLYNTFIEPKLLGESS